MDFKCFLIRERLRYLIIKYSPEKCPILISRMSFFNERQQRIPSFGPPQRRLLLSNSKTAFFFLESLIFKLCISILSKLNTARIFTSDYLSVRTVGKSIFLPQPMLKCKEKISAAVFLLKP